MLFEGCRPSLLFYPVAYGHGDRHAGQYVKAYAKPQKDDYADAEAIAEAATRPTMQSVPIKPVDNQTLKLLQRQRSGWISERTALVNSILLTG